ncbi:cystathionine beta-synthase, partial [Aeromonas veronii]|nr:cystathionine beta-synthase [Aeromonas veronii]
RVARELPAEAVMVVLLPDGGRGYLAKIFNDGWMRSYGFSEVEEGETVADVLAARAPRQGEGIPDLVHAHPTDTVLEAIGLLTEYDVSQLVVLSAEPPVMMGEVVG